MLVGTGGKGEVDIDIVLLNEARAVLGDPTRRREWEAARRDHLAQSLHTSSTSAPNASPHIFREISLELFTPHFPPSPPASLIQDEADPEPEPEFYTYPCRCSALFRITSEQLGQGVNVVGCEGCGEWIKVGYEVVEDEDGAGE